MKIEIITPEPGKVYSVRQGQRIVKARFLKIRVHDYRPRAGRLTRTFYKFLDVVTGIPFEISGRREIIEEIL